MRTARKIAIVLVALVVMTVGLALPAQAGAEGDFLSKINAARSSAGLPPVSMHSDLVPDARNHSAEMMAAGQIYHTSNLAGGASGWEALAENVGVGPRLSTRSNEFWRLDVFHNTRPSSVNASPEQLSVCMSPPDQTSVEPSGSTR